MTSLRRIAPTAEPAAVEARDVADTHDLAQRLKAIDGQRMLHARMNWDRLFSSAEPPGAVTPTVARETLTRRAIRAKEARRRAFRSGLSGLAHALRGAR